MAVVVARVEEAAEAEAAAAWRAPRTRSARGWRVTAAPPTPGSTWGAAERRAGLLSLAHTHFLFLYKVSCVSQSWRSKKNAGLSWIELLTPRHRDPPKGIGLHGEFGIRELTQPARYANNSRIYFADGRKSDEFV